MIDGELVVNPPQEKRGGGVDMDIIIAGTAQAILMIEGYANFVSEQTLLEAVAIGQKLITEISTGIDAWAARVGKGRDDRVCASIGRRDPHKDGQIRASLFSRPVPPAQKSALIRRISIGSLQVQTVPFPR